MKKYIPTLMEMYQDMVKENQKHEIDQKNKKESFKPDKYQWYFYWQVNPYSDTMLHSIITVINKLNNK